jgi:hypothetical protein
LIHAGRVYGLELKAAGGKLTPAQATTHNLMRAAGAVVGVAVGIDQAIAWLEANGLLRLARSGNCHGFMGTYLVRTARWPNRTQGRRDCFGEPAIALRCQMRLVGKYVVRDVHE